MYTKRMYPVGEKVIICKYNNFPTYFSLTSTYITPSVKVEWNGSHLIKTIYNYKKDNSRNSR